MSVTTFALCIDPFLGCLLVRSLVDLVRLTAYTGDLAVVLAHFWLYLPTTADDLERCAAAIGLSMWRLGPTPVLPR